MLAMFCMVLPKSFDPLPECEQGFVAVAIPIWISTSEYTIVSAISPRVVITLRVSGESEAVWVMCSSLSTGESGRG